MARVAELQHQLDSLQDQYRASENSGNRRILAGYIAKAANDLAWARYHEARAKGMSDEQAMSQYIGIG